MVNILVVGELSRSISGKSLDTRVNLLNNNTFPGLSKTRDEGWLQILAGEDGK
jgi:hypothetical protein